MTQQVKTFNEEYIQSKNFLKAHYEIVTQLSTD